MSLRDSIGPADPTGERKGTPRVSPSCGCDPSRSPVYLRVFPLLVLRVHRVLNRFRGKSGPILHHMVPEL